MNDTVIIFCAFSCMCRAQLWAESLGMPYSTETRKVVCSQQSVELYVTDAIKKGVDFVWIRSAGCSLHCQGIEDGIVTGVTRILIAWWCKQKNRMMNKASRLKVLKRKFQILSHQ